MATKNTFRLQSVVAKSANQPFSKPSNLAPQPSKIETLEDYLNDMNDQERLTFELERFGHFTIEEGGRWTQAEIDAEWDRQNASKLSNRASSQHSFSIGTLNLHLSRSTSLSMIPITPNQAN